MTQIQASNVIGGIENPRILICGPELITNQGFEENLNNWTEHDTHGNMTMTRVQNTTTPFGDYVMDLNRTGTDTSHSWADQTIAYGSAVDSKKFILSFYAKYGGSANQIITSHFFQGGDFINHTAMEYWKKFIHEITMPVSAGNNINPQLFPYDYNGGIGETGHALFDNVSVREVLYDIQLPLPWRNQFKHGFIPLLQSGYKLDNAKNKKFYKGLIYFYSAFWNVLTATEEQNRNKIIMENQISGRDLILFPHKDSDRCYFVSCENDRLQWSWMNGIALGHEGGIELIGNELFQMAPDDIVTESYYQGIIISEDIIIS